MSPSELHIVDFGRAICANFEAASQREWLVTNGLGGYAMGTISGVHTRRYHGLLIAAVRPPADRALLLAGVDDTAAMDGVSFPLYAHRWADLSISPHGYRNIERFYLEGTIPTWVFSLGEALLEKRIWMEQGANTTYIQYTLLRGSRPLELTLRPQVNPRDHHGDTPAGAARLVIQALPDSVHCSSRGRGDLADEFHVWLRCPGASFTPVATPLPGFYLAEEAYRGEPELDHAVSLGAFNTSLQPGESVTLVASTAPISTLDAAARLAEQREFEAEFLQRSGSSTPFTRQLTLAASQFIVRRPTPSNPDGQTVIAGYPWFADWGRDTMISLPGLALCTGRPELAGSLLRTFASYLDRGMIPNRFPDAGETPEYNTVDASLWFFVALYHYHRAYPQDPLLAELYPALQSIIDWHQKGTRYGIQLDPVDGLLRAGEEGIQLTWMDAKAGDWVVTPRIGKPVEINALWYSALRFMEVFSTHLGQSAQRYHTLAEQALQGFSRYWNSDQNCCYDVLDGPQGHEDFLRPNQLLAVSLPHSPLSTSQQRQVVDICAQRLLTSLGLRSLDQSNPSYSGRYGGHRRTRDAIYHQGTVWGWLIGPFISAHLRVYRDPLTARSYLEPFAHHLLDHGLGSISEIFDGDAPHTPRGCPAQAWSVAEVLRCLKEIELFESTNNYEATP